MPRTKRRVSPPGTIWEVPDSLWPVLEDILREFYPPATTGRPRGDLRRVPNGIIYRLRSGVPWNHPPAAFGSDTTVHRWSQRFVADGVFERVWAVLVGACDDLGGVDGERQSADTAMGRARFGGTSSARARRTGRSPAPSGAC